MKKHGFSKSIDRLLTHNPSGVYLKKKYIQSWENNKKESSKNQSLFEIDDPENIINFLKQQQQIKSSLKEESKTIAAIKLKQRVLKTKSQAHINNLLSNVQDSNNDRSSANLKSQNNIFQQVQQMLPIQKQNRIELKQKQNFSKWVDDWKKKNKKSKRPYFKIDNQFGKQLPSRKISHSKFFKDTQFLRVSRGSTKYINILKTQQSKILNNPKPSEIQISRFVSRYINKQKRSVQKDISFSKDILKLKNDKNSQISFQSKKINIHNDLNSLLKKKITQRCKSNRSVSSLFRISAVLQN